MQSLRDSLIHDATFLFRFVDSIERFVAEHESQFTYNDATVSYFLEVRSEVEKTKKFILELLGKASQSKSDADGLRYQRALTIQKDRWKIRHTYIKPAADADSLNVPGPLIRMAESHIRELVGAENSEVVVLLTPELMYFENRPSDPLGKGRVFLEIPYSQAAGFFGNLTIYHELGHYVWGRLAAEQPRRSAFAALVGSLEDIFANKIASRVPTPANRDKIKPAYDSWTQELFCDLFAVRHLGPASTFALIDILSLFGLMQDGDGDPSNDLTFNKNHPAPALRFRAQLKRLQDDGWWDCIQALPSEHIGLIRGLAEKKDSEYLFAWDNDDLPQELIHIFMAVLPLIHELAVDVTPAVKSRDDDFRSWRDRLESCFVNGVVPSQLVAEGASSPTPVSMINAAYCVYLARLSELMDKLDGQLISAPEHRQRWVERLEAWTMKGIDDYFLLSGLGEEVT